MNHSAYLQTEKLVAFAGGTDDTRGAQGHVAMGLPQHHQGIPRKGHEKPGDAEGPHTVPGSPALL